MTTVALLRQLVESGVRLVVDGDRVRFEPGSAPPDLIDRARESAKLLRAVALEQCRRCGEPEYLLTYWGDPLCRVHADALVELLDRNEWPTLEDSLPHPLALRAELVTRGS